MSISLNFNAAYCIIFTHRSMIANIMEFQKLKFANMLLREFDHSKRSR